MDGDKFIRPEDAVKLLRVTPGTLRSWANQGKISFTTTKGGHRRYKLSSVLNLTDAESGYTFEENFEEEKEDHRKKICYARVSSHGQKKDMETQIEYFKISFPNHTCIGDIGSGLNFKRKGFLSILDGAIEGTISEVVVTHRDRLCRFGFEIIERVLNSTGGRIVVLNRETLPPEQELVQDLLTITSVFSGRLHGLRSHALKRKIRDSTKTEKT